MYLKCVYFFLPAVLAGATTGVPQKSQPAAEWKGRVEDALAQMPIYFEPNLGQASPETKFLTRGKGMKAYLRPEEAMMVLTKQSTNRDTVVHMNLERANRSASAVAEGELPGVSGYFLGSNASSWIPRVPHYAKVRFRDVYAGIDVVYYGNQRDMEYDFIVRPGANPDQIQLSFNGARSIRTDADGDLLLMTDAGELRQRKPRVYQNIGGREVEVAASYKIRGSGVQFALATYDRNRPLVIDPIIVYSTFVGGNFANSANRIGVDSSGAVYIAGGTMGSDYPQKNSPWPAESQSSVISKFMPNDGQGPLVLDYSAYLPGKAYGMAVHPSGRVYLTGESEGNHPVQLSAQSCNGLKAFVTVLKPHSGNNPIELFWSTCVGGSSLQYGTAIAVNSGGVVYVTGSTQSADFPLVNSLMGKPATVAGGSNQNGFVFAMYPPFLGAPASVVFSTYLGGGDYDYPTGIAIDSEDSIYVTGWTKSTNFPAFLPWQTNQAGIDGFVTKITSPLNGPLLAYSTFIGGSGDDKPAAIAVDSEGAAYIGGTTDSQDFPLHQHFQTAKGMKDGFVVKLKPYSPGIPVAPVYSTYLGGPHDDHVSAIAVGNDGSAYMTGGTHWGFPTLLSLYQPQGNYDAFVTKFEPNDGRKPVALAWSTYLSGGNESYSTDDQAYAIALHGGNVYVAGNTWSPNFPVKNAYQQQNKGNGDAFLVKLTDSVTVTINSNVPGPTVIVNGTGCAAGTHTLPVTLTWVTGANCTIAVNQNQTTGETEFTYQGWWASQAGNPRAINNVTMAATYTAVFGVKHKLTTMASPGIGGTVTGNGTFFTAGQGVIVKATGNACYQHTGWSANAPNGITVMNEPKTITAYFQPLPVAGTVAGVMFDNSGIRLDNNTGRYQQSVFFTNTTGAVLSNAALMLEGLPGNVTLYQPDGFTQCVQLVGSPYRNLGNLQPGQSVKVDLEFIAPGTVFNYTPKVLAGSALK